MTGERFSHYRILEPLAAGGMGQVYAAEDVRLGRRVAIKFLSEEFSGDAERMARLEQEARTLAKLKHPSIVTLYEIERYDGKPCLVMELVDGRPLSQLIPSHGMQVSKLLDIATTVADALVAIHATGIVHRDLKPGNVLVEKSGAVKVCDVGLAVPLPGEAEPDESTATMTAIGSLSGTFPYMSPERIQGVRNDPRSDLFSFGVMLHEMATGRRPFRGNNDLELATQILHRVPPSPAELRPELPEDLGRIILHCLQKDPERRYQTAKGLRSELHELKDAETSARSLHTGGILRRARRPARRLVAAALGAALLVLVAMAAVDTLRRSTSTMQSSRLGEGGRVQVLLDQATVYERRGDSPRDLAHAEAVLRRALAAAPDDPQVQARLADLLGRRQSQHPEPGRSQEARDLAEAALAEDPHLAAAWAARSQLARMDGDWQEAERNARRAVEADPAYTRGHGLLGEALLGQGRVDEAIQAASGALEVAHDEVWGRLMLAKILMSAGRNNEAVANYEKVLELAPDSPNARANLGAIYAYTGRELEAIPLLRQTLEEHPADAVATNLGYALFELGRYQEAAEAFETAHELAPDLPSHERNLADAYEALGDQEQVRLWLERALEDYDRALESGGSQPRLLAERAVAAAKLGRLDEARSDIESAAGQVTSDPFVLFNAAQVAALRHDDDELRRRMREALAAGYPRDPFHSDRAFSEYREEGWFSELLLAPVGL